MKAIVIAGTASGVGKTTIATGLIAALRRSGHTVQPFKVGPDYIDPSYHSAAAGRPSRNLDTWLVPQGRVKALFRRAMGSADVGIVEGVMGLFDGRHGEAEQGSTAQVAKLLGLPVVLVVDAAKSARSVGAAALGFRVFDTNVNLAGVILNRVSSESHARAACDAVEREAGLRVLGSVGRDAAPRLPERYLGLVPAAEQGMSRIDFDLLANQISSAIDVDALLEVAECGSPTGEAEADLFPAEPIPPSGRIAVARDEAFSFLYEDNLDLLRAWGAELIGFSPIHDQHLPGGCSGLYLGGGFPELHARRLAANATLRAEIAGAVARGMPVYAECGGLMYLARALVDRDGRTHEMVGALPIVTDMRQSRLTIGYREMTALRDSVLAPAGTQLRAHEFHWSTCRPPSAAEAAYWVEHGDDRIEGFVKGSVIASYLHLHFATDPGLAPRFVEACQAWSHSTSGDSGPASQSRLNGTAPPYSEPEQGPKNDTSTPVVGPLLARLGLPPAAIEAESRRRIEAAIGPALPPNEPNRSVVTRLVYASGDHAIAQLVRISTGAVQAGVDALRRGSLVVVDVNMVAVGLDSRRLTRLGIGKRVVVAVTVPGAAELARSWRITRSAAGMLLSADALDGAVVAVGNAPTALLAVLDLVNQGRARPALIVGLPVGFVAAAEAKAALEGGATPFITIAGPRGGSGLAVALLNLLLSHSTGAPLSLGVRVAGAGARGGAS